MRRKNILICYRGLVEENKDTDEQAELAAQIQDSEDQLRLRSPTAEVSDNTTPNLDILGQTQEWIKKCDSDSTRIPRAEAGNRPRPTAKLSVKGIHDSNKDACHSGSDSSVASKREQLLLHNRLDELYSLIIVNRHTN